MQQERHRSTVLAYEIPPRREPRLNPLWAIALGLGYAVIDIHMPEMDGLALLRAVRGHPAVRKLPFILLTGRGDRELVVKAAQAGVNNYLVKPFTQVTLREKIEQVIGKLS